MLSTTPLTVSPAARANNDQSKPVPRKRAHKDYMGLILALRTQLNEISFTHLKSSEFIISFGFATDFMGYLVKKEFLEVKKTTYLHHTFRLTEKFKRQVTAANLERLYADCLSEIAVKTKLRAREKRADARTTTKPVKAEAPYQVASPETNQFVSQPATSVMTADSVIQITSEQARANIPTFLPASTPKVASKSLDVSWKVDNDSYTVMMEVSCPDGTDYKDVLVRGLLLLGIKLD